MSDNIDRTGVLGAIKNPLVFFSLALLVIEGVIGAAAAFSRIASSHFVYVVLIMASLFVSVVAVVALITIRWPRHLYASISRQLEKTQQIAEFIEDRAFHDFVAQRIAELVKEDCVRD